MTEELKNLENDLIAMQNVEEVTIENKDYLKLRMKRETVFNIIGKSKLALNKELNNLINQTDKII